MHYPLDECSIGYIIVIVLIFSISKSYSEISVFIYGFWTSAFSKIGEVAMVSSEYKMLISKQVLVLLLEVNESLTLLFGNGPARFIFGKRLAAKRGRYFVFINT